VLKASKVFRGFKASKDLQEQLVDKDFKVYKEMV
jgi:hypothetical protein